jgi:hypothetical protein
MKRIHKDHEVIKLDIIKPRKSTRPRLYAADDTFNEEGNNELKSQHEHEGIGSAKKPDVEMHSEDSQEDKPSIDRDEIKISVQKFNPKRSTFQTPSGNLNRIHERSKESTVSKVEESNLSKHCKQEFEEEIPENAGKENKFSKGNIGSKMSVKNSSEKFSKMQNVTQQLPIQSPVVASIDVDRARLSISQPNNEFKYAWMANPMDSIAYTKHKAMQRIQ